MAVPALRRQLQQKQVDFAGATRIMKAVGRLYGGVSWGASMRILSPGGRSSSPEQNEAKAEAARAKQRGEVGEDLLGEPALRGRPTAEEWQIYHELWELHPEQRALGEHPYLHFTVFPEKAWSEQDRARYEDAERRYLEADDHEGFLVVLLTALLHAARDYAVAHVATLHAACVRKQQLDRELRRYFAGARLALDLEPFEDPGAPEPAATDDGDSDDWF